MNYVNRRISSRRKTDREFILALIVFFLTIGVLFYSLGYEEGARHARNVVLGATK